MRQLGLSGSRLLAHSRCAPLHCGHERLTSHLILSSGLRRRLHPLLPPIGRRSFSVQTFVESSITTVQHLFTELHAVTATPWYISIPLIALSINLFGRLPISLYTRSVAQKRSTLTPLMTAWYSRHVNDVSRTPGNGSPEAAKKKVDKTFKRTTRRVYREFGVQRWKDFSFLGILPLWLTGIEAMRRLSGSSKGLLGTLFSGPGDQEPGPAAAQAENNAAEAAQTLADNPVFTPQPASPDQSILPDLSLGADPTLATEGCLWFPDLTVADPYHILPLILSAVLLLRLLPMNRIGFEVLLGTRPPPQGTAARTFGRPLHRGLILLAIMVGPATMNLPAAVHLYWVSSAVITNLQSEIINRYMKLAKQPGRVARGRESTLVSPPPPPAKQDLE